MDAVSFKQYQAMQLFRTTPKVLRLFQNTTRRKTVRLPKGTKYLQYVYYTQTLPQWRTEKIYCFTTKIRRVWIMFCTFFFYHTEMKNIEKQYCREKNNVDIKVSMARFACDKYTKPYLLPCDIRWNLPVKTTIIGARE